MLQHLLTNSQQHIFSFFAESLWPLLGPTFFFFLILIFIFSSRTSLKHISPQTKILETQTQLSKPQNELPLFSLSTTVFNIAVYLTNHFIFEWSLFWRIFVQMLLDFLQIEKKLFRHGVTFNDTYIYSVHTQGSHPACH